MGKKKKHPEHINLERWLISYADFITLLFATFVVLYALSQVDIKDFKALQESIQQAFAAPSLIQGNEGVMQNASENAVFDTSQADSMIAPLMMEYVSQKYEEDSMNDIQKDIQDATKSGELDGVESYKTDRGLLIRFTDNCLFAEGSAALSPAAKTKIDKVGKIISKKFFLHIMRVEGHTDNQPFKSNIYPSNWELSSARACSVIRYLMGRFNFMPSLFTAVGFAETRPLADNKTAANQAKNRRVEILILKNKFRNQENPVNAITKMSKDMQDQLQASRINAINRIDAISDAAKKLSNGDKKAEEGTIVLNKVYNQEAQRITKETQVLDPQTQNRIKGEGNWLKTPSASQIKVFKQ